MVGLRTHCTRTQRWGTPKLCAPIRFAVRYPLHNMVRGGGGVVVVTWVCTGKYVYMVVGVWGGVVVVQWGMVGVYTHTPGLVTRTLLGVTPRGT